MDESALIERFGLHKSLRFQSVDGQIWFDQSRMVLLDVKSLGQLRGELVEQLGPLRARGLMWRMGFRGGQEAARVALKHAANADDYDYFRLGPAIHALLGIVKTDIVGLEIDWEAASLEGTVQWVSSWEAQAHREQGLPLDELEPTACWSLSGFASGFVSEYFKRLIVFREQSCTCSGAEKCVVVGKPADAWGDDALVELLGQGEGGGRRMEAEEELRQLRHQAGPSNATEHSQAGGSIVGQSPAFLKAFGLVRKAVSSSISVLLLGETGVGKEVFARWLHEHGPQADGPFVAVNCAAIPMELVEAELFGVKRGAFTGAEETRAGRFERADGGTLFLDEIGDLPLQAQVKLLRALQSGEIERLGDPTPIKVKVRVISATNAQLDDAIKAGRFRSDLYYRLATYPVNIPPLRDRSADILLLAQAMMERFCPIYEKKLSGLTDHARWMIESYSWPGNVRELENVIERAVLLAEDGEPIGIEHLPRELDIQGNSAIGLARTGQLETKAHRADSRLLETLLVEGFDLAAHELDLAEKAMEMAGGNLGEAARILKVTKRQLSYRLGKSEGGHA